ncbi:hypothetical protein BD309DRAFT_958683 [Dichomitus squalens]|uniref:Uncharacterized protein n=1 Tax=Dichomitus squalens TaxID=114155 RepID=A0A4Q9QBX0_9APHY|nr:hypothetical protein BD309DRAFT_958683 [Dichomitus squalens]TBU65217.1 hypothetical protein BD310DRAFT_914276 [Dichomitus squalens]
MLYSSAYLDVCRAIDILISPHTWTDKEQWPLLQTDEVPVRRRHDSTATVLSSLSDAVALRVPSNHAFSAERQSDSGKGRKAAC